MKLGIVFSIAITLNITAANAAVDPVESAKGISISFITEHFPPFSYQEEGRLQGISVDLLEKMLLHMNKSLNKSEIELLPWDQGYQITQNQNNTAIFSAGRVPEREPFFKWVGPISSIKPVLFSFSKRQINVSSPEYLKRLKIGVARDTADGPLAIEAGANPDNLVVKNNTDELIEALKSGAIDAWAYPDITGIMLADQAGLPAGELEIVYQLDTETPLYYAFNKNTSDSTIDAFQGALNLTKKGKGADGISDFEKVLYRYLPVVYGKSLVTPGQVMGLVNRTSVEIEEDVAEAFINISKGGHPFKDNPEIICFVLDEEGNLMAHSSRPELIGLNEMNRSDVSGKRFIEDIVEGALKHGSGREDYIYSSPDMTGLYYKTAYYRLAMGSDGRGYIVGCIDYKNE